MRRPVPATALSALWLVLLLFLAGCATTGVAPAAAAAAGPTHSSLGNLPDPFVLIDSAAAYVYATNGQGRNVQVLMSRRHVADGFDDDPAHFAWAALPDAMPNLAPWVVRGFTWAPEVVRLGSNLVMYYTARDRRTNRPCIGVAVGTSPAGPFIDSRSGPLLCQEPDGTIDASPFVADGRVFLYVKSDGNCCGRPTTLYAQELSADGLALQGSPVALLQNDPAGWEGGVIEAPTMLLHEGRHLLFYSGNAFGNAAYGVGVAACDSALGPCRRMPAAQPLLKSRGDSIPPLVGPGHQALFRIGNTTWIAYHAWELTPDSQRGARRFLHIDRVDWNADGSPAVRGPSLLP